MDPAEQLQQLYVAGFDLQTFDRYPQAIGVSRGDCIALLIPGIGGLQMLGTPGWRMGEVLGVLTTVGDRRVFQFKEQVIDATPERIEAVEQFKRDIFAVIRPAQ